MLCDLEVQASAASSPVEIFAFSTFLHTLNPHPTTPKDLNFNHPLTLCIHPAFTLLQRDPHSSNSLKGIFLPKPNSRASSSH